MGCFDEAFERFLAADMKRSKIRLKQEQLNSVSAARCGNCRLWMTAACKPERVYKQFKSADSAACDSFDRSESSQKMQSVFEAEMSDIKLGK